MARKIIRLLIVAAIFVFCLNLLISFAVTEKPWYERLILTGASAFGGGGIGALAGFIIGGIGVALMGTAVGILGWVAFGLFGFSVGAMGGSLYTIITSPHFYDFQIWILILVIFLAGGLAWCVNRLLIVHEERIFALAQGRTPEENGE